MLIVGDKIRLIKRVPNLEVGSVFEVTSVGDYIGFKCDYGKGIMSFKEFENYFEVIREEKKYEDINSIKPCKLDKHMKNGLRSEFLGNIDDIYYRTNKKDIELFYRSKKVVAKLHPTDEFNLTIGLMICMYRMNKIICDSRLNQLINKIVVKEN